MQCECAFLNSSLSYHFIYLVRFTSLFIYLDVFFQGGGGGGGGGGRGVSISTLISQDINFDPFEENTKRFYTRNNISLVSVIMLPPAHY